MKFRKFFTRQSRGENVVRGSADLEELFLDIANIPAFNKGRLEGRLETALSRWRLYAVFGVFLVVGVGYIGYIGYLQIVRGDEFRAISEANSIDRSILFAERGPIYDRTGEILVSNLPDNEQHTYSLRRYTTREGLGTLLGYVSYPRKDSRGFYYRTDYIGRGGVEESFDDRLSGTEGEQLLEVDAFGEVVSEHVVHPSVPGETLTLSVDAALSEALYRQIATTTIARGFRSGAAAMMDVETGEIIALASYPSIDSNTLLSGDEERIALYTNDERLPFLNKVISGVYTPGSVVKPFVAFAALRDNVVDPSYTVFSSGRLVIPNPYTPSQPSVFTDWRAHGTVNMRRAIAVSSNIYFYVVGGGLDALKGVGITRLFDMFQAFKLGDKTGVPLIGEVTGTVPNPAWKERLYEDGDWRLGDTYLTAIGQFGFQTTPLALLRAYAAIANGGTLVTPSIEKGVVLATSSVEMSDYEHRIITEGMREAVVDGTARTLQRSDIHIAAKTGTAELGVSKAFVNSWVVGYYPYEKPKYAFIFMMEHGPRANLFGSSPAFAEFLNWVKANKPEYLIFE